MTPVQFTASQVRVAATCPRIFHFDVLETRRRRLRTPAVTRIWKLGESDSTACGTLFHASIEQFHRRAARTRLVHRLLAEAPGGAALGRAVQQYVYDRCVNHDRLYAASPRQQEGFVAALTRYLEEVADILDFGRRSGLSAEEIVAWLFGDERRRVDVTFAVGPGGEPVHVSGVLDYLFFDFRVRQRRILDYKLTPGHEPAGDLFQVAVYALMHHVQHGTETDVAVLYLHPMRRMIERSWEEVHARRHEVYDLLASMAAWSRFDPRQPDAAGTLRPPGAPAYCDRCPWERTCVARLGLKEEGSRSLHWTEASEQTVRSDERKEPRHQPEGPQGSGDVEERLHDGGLPGFSSSASAEENAFHQGLEPGDEGARPRPEGEGIGALLRIGETAEEGCRVELPAAALATHAAVVGAAGSGKTWLAKVVAEEAILAGVPVLAVDPQGDLVQFLRQRPPKELEATHRERCRQFARTVEPRVFTPGSSHARRICLNPLRVAREGDLAATDPARRAEEVDELLKTVAANVVRIARTGGETDSQAAFLLMVLRHLAARRGPALELATLAEALADPPAFGIAESEALIRKAERERLTRKLNALIHGPAEGLFHGGESLDVARICRGAPGRVPLNVVYLNALVDDDQKQFFVAALAAEIYRWMITTGGGSGLRLLFYLDEARDYLPAGNRKPPAKEPLVRLFSQARKYGVGCLVCTQSPRSVDYNVFGNCSTKVVGRLEARQDVERVADWFRSGGPVPEWIAARKGAASGSFVARWPQMSEGLEGRVIRSRPLFSRHEGAWSPDRLEEEVNAPLDRPHPSPSAP